MSKDLIYDIETFRYLFTCAIINVKTGKRTLYEISNRRNDLTRLKNAMLKMQVKGYRMVGFNNVGFDYPVLHYIFEECFDDMSVAQLNERIYKKAMSIIDTPWDDRFRNIIWDRDQIVPQLDLYKIHHFDNVSRATSLKMLEFNMRMNSIQDLPYPPDQPLTSEQMDHVIDYNWHDDEATLEFYELTKPMIEFRETMTREHGRNFLNHNDTKIGKDYFVMELESKLGKDICFEKVDGRRKPRQTIRKHIHIKDVIFDYVDFKLPQFNAVVDWLNRQTISQTKGVFTGIPEKSLGDLVDHCNLKKVKGNIKNLNCVVDGFQFDFGTGGIHGSVESQVFESDDEWMVWDWDVTSYYPSLAIANDLFPKHLGSEFCHIYADMKTQRMRHKKGTVGNAMLKLALNGVYGDSNSKFSPFYDPQYTMGITVNGQLLLCMLFQQLRESVPELKIIQINTDGLTIHIKRKYADIVRRVCGEWELTTGLDLEEVEYSKMFVRDVNNYIACYEGGVKRKGQYEYKIQWHQNHNSLVVARAAEAHLLDGIDIRTFITNWEDDYDFFRRTKVPRNSRLEMNEYDAISGEHVSKTELQRITRYYVSKNGGELTKIMPPLPKKPDKERPIGIDIGWLVTPCNDTIVINRNNLDYEFYIREAEKLVEPFRA